jgi:glycosyltransferase involved in cell wall biosynthesis
MNVLYLSYTGLAEPLGQSQVLAYLRGLSGKHRITLVTFEKPADLADAGAITALRAQCGEHGIRWLARRYHHRPRLLATAWDLAMMIWTAFRQARTGDIALVHARSLLPAFIALGLKRAFAIPFIFEMRAFWPEEMATAGRLKRQSPMFRLLTWAERLCLSRADCVVLQAHAAVTHLQRAHGSNLAPLRVIATCVDLDRFHCRQAGETEGPPVIGTVGTVLSGWFRLDWLMAFLRASTGVWSDARFHIVTRDAPARIAAAAERVGIDPQRLVVESRPPGEMPQVLARLNAVVMFFEPGLAKLASCPTRMGEALAAGLPVVANEGVGDVAEIIRKYGVGVVLEDASEPSMRQAAAELGNLLRDPELSARCRKAAEDWFSLAAGVAAYDALYGEVTASGAAGSREPKPLPQPVRGGD